jgi:hypothetical protein
MSGRRPVGGQGDMQCAVAQHRRVQGRMVQDRGSVRVRGPGAGCRRSAPAWVPSWSILPWRPRGAWSRRCPDIGENRLRANRNGRARAFGAYVRNRNGTGVASGSAPFVEDAACSRRAGERLI